MPSSVTTRTSGYSQVEGSSAGMGSPKYQGLAAISSRRTSTAVIFMPSPVAAALVSRFPPDARDVLHVRWFGSEGVVDGEDRAIVQLDRMRVTDVVEIGGRLYRRDRSFADDELVLHVPAEAVRRNH